MKPKWHQKSIRKFIDFLMNFGSPGVPPQARMFGVGGRGGTPYNEFCVRVLLSVLSFHDVPTALYECAAGFIGLRLCRRPPHRA